MRLQGKPCNHYRYLWIQGFQNFKILHEILSEIKTYINFNLVNINKISDLNLKKRDNYLIVSEKKIKDVENLMVIKDFPINITKLIEAINIQFLKRKYNQQSEIDLGFYKLDLNYEGKVNLIL